MPTPAEPGQPQERQVLEPIVVLRPRSTDALAELFREMTEEADSYEAVELPVAEAGGEADTEELPPVPAGGSDRDWERARPGTRQEPAGSRAPAGERHRYGSPRPAGGGRPAGEPTRVGSTRAEAGDRRLGRERARTGPGAGLRRTGSGTGLRRAAVTVAVGAAALLGFGCALLLTGRDGEAAAQTPQPTPTPTAAASSSTDPSADPSADPDGPGTLREGDSGPEVTDLQQRLLRIPNVYDGGATDGAYGAALTEAVARFQVWYGIRGDENGVYGNDTRQALESRTAG